MDRKIIRLLIVEDDEEDYILARELLAQSRGQRFQVTWARSYAAGLKALLGESFDVALVDYNLGDGNGIDLIRAAQAGGAGLPMLMLTGQGSYELDVEAMRAGAADYLSKNEATGPLLERAIRYAMERQQAGRVQETVEAERDRLLNENERQRGLLEAILEVDPGGIALVSGPNFVFQFANPAYRLQTPHPEIDPVGQPFSHIWPEEEGFTPTGFLEQVVATGQPAHFTPITRAYPDGVERSFTAHAYHVPAGDPRTVLIVVWEITEAEQARRAAEHSSLETNRRVEELGSILSSLANAVIVSDIHGTPTYANPSAAETLGFDPLCVPHDEVYSRVQLRAPDGHELAPEQRPSSRALRGESVSGEHIHITGADGRTHSIIASASPLHQNDQITGAVLAWHEISEQEQLMEQLRAEQARLESLLEALPVAVWIANAEGKVTEKNAAADRLWAGSAPLPENFYQYGAYRAWSADIGEEIRPEDRPLARAVLRQESTFGQQLRIQRLDGSVGTVLCSAAPIYDPAGNMIGGVVVDMDTTTQTELEQQLKQRKEELERSNQDLQDFASIISHDLKEPLRKINGFGELLARRYSDRVDEGGLDYIQRMRSAAERMTRMIDDLLTYSRVSTRGRPFTAVDLAQVVEVVLADLEMRITQTQAQVQVGKLPTIDADPTQMQHLLQNLIGNALKFHRPDVSPRVEVTCKDLPGKRIELAVADNGIGMDLSDVERIFLPFQRMVHRDEYEGSGIGLAICRRIVERHGGQIRVESTPGQGSTFYVTLPVKHE